MSNERLDELKKKLAEVGGYMGLSKKEREEYSALKKEPTKEKPKEDTVTLSRAELGDLIGDAVSKEAARIREADSEGFEKMDESKWHEYKEPKDRNKTATLKIYQEDSDREPELVVKCVVHTHYGMDEETRRKNKLVFKVTLLSKDGETREVKMDAVDYAQIRNIETVELIKNDRKILRKVDGKVWVNPKNKEGYVVRRLGDGTGRYGVAANEGHEVDLEVLRVEENFVAKRESGQEFEIAGDCLNN